jgi:hypothetical protein
MISRQAIRDKPSRTVLQRKCACGGTPGPTGECKECREKRLRLQRTTRDPGLGTRSKFGIPSIVQEVLHSRGQPLDAPVRGFFEPRFGHDFSKVRVHTDGRAAESARFVDALAYTVGKHLVFGAGHYSPSTLAGGRLLAHELTHIVQQSNRDEGQGELSVGPPNDEREFEADAMAAALAEPLSAGIRPIAKLSPAPPGVIQRQTTESSGPSGILGKTKYLLQDVANVVDPRLWWRARACLEGLFPSMHTNTFDRWIPVACARSGSGILHSREWDAFGHCWIGCEGTRQCGGPQTWVYGLGHEVSREWESRTGGAPHDSLSQDISNQIIGRAASVEKDTCFSICDGLHKHSFLNLTAPRRTCVNCATYPASGEGPCPGSAAPP